MFFSGFTQVWRRYAWKYKEKKFSVHFWTTLLLSVGVYVIRLRTRSHARIATSPALGSASICQFPVSNKMDGWRMEIMVGTYPTLVPAFALTLHPFLATLLYLALANSMPCAVALLSFSPRIPYPNISKYISMRYYMRICKGNSLKNYPKRLPGILRVTSSRSM